MSLFLFKNVALDLIRLFLKSTIKAISSRFTLGFHGSNLQPASIPHYQSCCSVLMIMCSLVLTCEMMALNLSGSIITDDQNRCKSVSLPPGQTISVVVCQIGNCELTPAPGASGHPIAHSVSSTLGNYQLACRFQTHVTID